MREACKRSVRATEIAHVPKSIWSREISLKENHTKSHKATQVAGLSISTAPCVQDVVILRFSTIEYLRRKSMVIISHNIVRYVRASNPFNFFHFFDQFPVIHSNLSIVNKHTSINSNSHLISINMQLCLTLVLATAVAYVSGAPISSNAKDVVSVGQLQTRRSELQSD